MPLNWYIQRLRNMSCREIIHRVAEKTRKEGARGRSEGWERYQQPNGSPLPVLPGLIEGLRGASETLRRLVSEAACATIDGHFAALGQTWPKLDFTAERNEFDLIWHLDPVTGSYWPHDQYCFDIKYRGSRNMGDVKYVWELGRLQMLQSVAAHVALTGEPTAVVFLERAIESWQKANPPFRGVAWSSGIELALRAISLLIVATLAETHLSEDTRARIATILAAHAFWIERYPSRFSSANNHLVAEDAALFLIGLSCSFLPENQRRRLTKNASEGLLREAELQICSDGTPAEQSPTYGALTAELFVLCARVAARLNAPLPPQLNERLSAYADYVRWISDQTGRVPAIGDDDEGRVIALGLHETHYPASVTAAISAHLGRDDLMIAHNSDLRNILIPTNGKIPAAHLGTKCFLEGGYTVHRGSFEGHSTLLVIDHAPLGYLSIAAHGHADALSFTLDVDDMPVLVDPGTYLYHSGHQWRDWFRGTRAHNTLNVQHANQSKISGAFNWSAKANSRIEHLNYRPFCFGGSHDGYYREFGITHRREVREIADGYEVQDQCLGGRPNIELVFQLAPDCDAALVEQPDHVLVRVSRDDRHILCIIFPPGGTLTASKGGEEPDGGWVSPQFGERVPATRLSWNGPAMESLITRIRLASR